MREKVSEVVALVMILRSSSAPPHLRCSSRAWSRKDSVQSLSISTRVMPLCLAMISNKEPHEGSPAPMDTPAPINSDNTPSSAFLASLSALSRSASVR